MTFTNFIPNFLKYTLDAYEINKRQNMIDLCEWWEHMAAIIVVDAITFGLISHAALVHPMMPSYCR